ncbi:TRP-domain-containing protein, partial [Mollisia scopiformis]
VLSLMGMVSADRIFESSSLDSCQSNSSFTASLFTIVFAPDNRTLALNVIGDSSVTGNVTFKVHASVYGYTFLTETLDPCTLGLASMCPMSSIQTDFDTIYTNVSASVIGRIPNIAYQIPDLDAVVTVYMYSVDDPTVSLACLEARISNGKTVDQVGVRWATAVISIVGLIVSGIISSLGFTNTAAHMMIYTLSLFSYFQAVAIIGLCAVPLPPIVQSWTQDMSWSVGVINVGFLQRFARWYQIATGGTPSTILTTLSTKSVQVAKRSMETALSRRATTETTASGDYIVTGIARLAYIEGMEATNLFFTAAIFYFIFVVFGVILVLLYKALCELLIRSKKIGSESHLFHFIHNGWRITLKGTIFRLILIGYPPMMILSLWEFTQDDSPAEIFLAVVFFFGMSTALAYASFKVFKIAKRSEQMYKTAAYSLYADATILNKWGFLYTQYKASAYLYIIPMFVYALLKAAFVGLGQKSRETQAIALVMIEAFALIGASVVRPWMDKTTNAINISICVINFLNAIMLLIFTNVFDGPGLLIGVLGVVFFIANVVFALALLVIVLFVIALSFIRKDPDTQYLPVADNRASFIKSQTTLNQELDALGATARG